MTLPRLEAFGRLWNPKREKAAEPPREIKPPPVVRKRRHIADPI